MDWSLRTESTSPPHHHSLSPVWLTLSSSTRSSPVCLARSRLSSPTRTAASLSRSAHLLRAHRLDSPSTPLLLTLVIVKTTVRSCNRIDTWIHHGVCLFKMRKLGDCSFIVFVNGNAAGEGVTTELVPSITQIKVGNDFVGGIKFLRFYENFLGLETFFRFQECKSVLHDFRCSSVL